MRKSATNKNGWKKYYSVMRPVSIGTHPAIGLMDFINYDDRAEIQAHNGVIKAWAELYYNRELTKKELQDYELVKA